MQPHELDVVIAVWHEVCRDTYTFIEIERDRPLAERHRFFSERIAPHCALWVATEAGAIVAYMALRESYVDRLYVLPEAQRRGAGAALIAKARELFPNGLELHTHVKNTGARSFYDKQGFQAVRFGLSPPPENEPDVEYHWRPREA